MKKICGNGYSYKRNFFLKIEIIQIVGGNLPVKKQNTRKNDRG